MHNIQRNNYTPKIGDYHNTIVHDEALGKIWLFDCDGVYLDMSKTNVRVVNEAGQSEDYAISQKFVTNRFAGIDTTIVNVDTASQSRDTTLQNNLNTVSNTLQANITTVNNNAISRENAIKNTLTARINNLDDECENLTEITDNLTDNVATLNEEAVFGVTLSQAANVTLAVTDGQTLTNYTFREATAQQNGLMPVASYNQITQNKQDIEKLKNAGLYRGSFNTLADAPTTTPDERFIGGEIYQNDVITIRNATHEGETGVARYRATVTGSNVSYSFDYFVDKEITNFTNGSAGLIVGSTTDGNVSANANGTGSVAGWATVKGDISANAANIATNTSDIAENAEDIAAANAAITALGTRMETAEGDIDTNTANITTNASNISTNTSAITTINAKTVKGSTDTTFGANSEPLLTHAGEMKYWVDITETGLPASPDANTFYYTVES